jgi:hypothetical protein
LQQRLFRRDIDAARRGIQRKRNLQIWGAGNNSAPLDAAVLDLYGLESFRKPFVLDFQSILT